MSDSNDDGLSQGMDLISNIFVNSTTRFVKGSDVYVPENNHQDKLKEIATSSDEAFAAFMNYKKRKDSVCSHKKMSELSPQFDKNYMKQSQYTDKDSRKYLHRQSKRFIKTPNSNFNDSGNKSYEIVINSTQKEQLSQENQLKYVIQTEAMIQVNLDQIARQVQQQSDQEEFEETKIKTMQSARETPEEQELKKKQQIKRAMDYKKETAKKRQEQRLEMFRKKKQEEAELEQERKREQQRQEKERERIAQQRLNPNEKVGIINRTKKTQVQQIKNKPRDRLKVAKKAQQNVQDEKQQQQAKQQQQQPKQQRNSLKKQTVRPISYGFTVDDILDNGKKIPVRNPPKPIINEVQKPIKQTEQINKQPKGKGTKLQQQSEAKYAKQVGQSQKNNEPIQTDKDNNFQKVQNKKDSLNIKNDRKDKQPQDTSRKVRDIRLPQNEPISRTTNKNDPKVKNPVDNSLQIISQKQQASICKIIIFALNKIRVRKMKQHFSKLQNYSKLAHRKYQIFGKMLLHATVKVTCQGQSHLKQSAFQNIKQFYHKSTVKQLQTNISAAQVRDRLNRTIANLLSMLYKHKLHQSWLIVKQHKQLSNPIQIKATKMIVMLLSNKYTSKFRTFRNNVNQKYRVLGTTLTNCNKIVKQLQRESKTIAFTNIMNPPIKQQKNTSLKESKSKHTQPKKQTKQTNNDVTKAKQQCKRLHQQHKELKTKTNKENKELANHLQTLKKILQENNKELQFKKQLNEELRLKLDNENSDSFQIEKDTLAETQNQKQYLEKLSNIYLKCLRGEQLSDHMRVQSIINNVQCNSNRDRIIEQWSVLKTHSDLKKVIGQYETQYDHKTKSYEVLEHQYETTRKLVRNYIKERYLWECIESSVDGYLHQNDN